MIEPNNNGELHFGSPMSVRQKSNSEPYNWQMENYESQFRECWSIDATPYHSIHNYFSIPTIPKVFEKKVREYLTLVPTSNQMSTLPHLWYKERDSPQMHINEISNKMLEGKDDFRAQQKILQEKFPIGGEFSTLEFRRRQQHPHISLTTSMDRSSSQKKKLKNSHQVVILPSILINVKRSGKSLSIVMKELGLLCS